MTRCLISCGLFLAALSQAAGCDKASPDLHRAVKACDAAKVSAAVAAGANVESLSPDGLTPLGQGALCFDAAVVKALLAGGAKVDGRDAQAWTPLMWAQDELVVASLLEAGANVNATNQDGETPLMFAKDAAIAKRLIEAGADTRVKDKSGETATDRLKKSSSAFAEEIIAVIQESQTQAPGSP